MVIGLACNLWELIGSPDQLVPLCSEISLYIKDSLGGNITEETVIGHSSSLWWLFGITLVQLLVIMVDQLCVLMGRVSRLSNLFNPAFYVSSRREEHNRVFLIDYYYLF